MSEQVPATIVNHVAVDIAASPDAVWEVILYEYIEANKFRSSGYKIETIDDPAAALGGYRIKFEQDGKVLDDRICHITERDEAARRLSMFADYLSVPGGLQVYATYHAREAAGGASYALDCHARMNVDAGADMAELTKQFDAGLVDYLNGIKSRLETAD
jgi:hypothetical protein